MPLSALFILFDFIIYNPQHPDVRSNLTLLDITVGHFSLLDHASGGSLPGSHLSEFSHIARRYVHELPGRAGDETHEPVSAFAGRRHSSNETPDTAREVCFIFFLRRKEQEKTNMSRERRRQLSNRNQKVLTKPVWKMMRICMRARRC